MTKVYVTVNVNAEGEVFEVFVNANDAELADTANALGRMVTQMIRYGSTVDNVDQAIKHLKRGQSNMMSLPSQLARIIEEVTYKGVEFPRGETDVDTVPIQQAEAKRVFEQHGVPKKSSRKFAPCPSCGEQTYDKIACVCTSCGESRCG